MLFTTNNSAGIDFISYHFLFVLLCYANAKTCVSCSYVCRKVVGVRINKNEINLRKTVFSNDKASNKSDTKI